MYSRRSFIYKYDTSTLTPFVKQCNILNLAVLKVFYIQLYVESTFKYNPWLTNISRNIQARHRGLPIPHWTLSRQRKDIFNFFATCNSPLEQRTLIAGGRITVQLVSFVTRLDSTASLPTNNNVFSALVKSNLVKWRQGVQWYTQVWPDLAKFRYFGHFYAIGQIFNVVNGQILNKSSSHLVTLTSSLTAESADLCVKCDWALKGLCERWNRKE